MHTDRRLMQMKILKTVLVLTAVMSFTGIMTSLAASGNRSAQETGGPGIKEELLEKEKQAAADAAGQPEADAAGQPQRQPVVDGVIRPWNLGGTEEADQLIVVVGTGGCGADVYYYKKSEDAWDMAWKEAGIVGRNGITSRKAEGDGSTPAGTYGFTMAFGLKEDPGSSLPYHKIVKGDYWVDDSASPYYNKLVNTAQTPKSWNSAENMAAASPYYNYALALDYNGDCAPGKGSAIFLHCFTASADSGSAGCIRLPEERVKELAQSVTTRTRIVIAADLSMLEVHPARNHTASAEYFVSLQGGGGKRSGSSAD